MPHLAGGPCNDDDSVVRPPGGYFRHGPRAALAARRSMRRAMTPWASTPICHPPPGITGEPMNKVGDE